MNYYQRYLRSIMRGERLNPRGMETWVLYNATFEFKPGTCWRRPHDNPAIGLIEGLQFIASTEDKAAIAAVAPNVNLSLFGPTSFYGPRTAGQFEQAIEELRVNPASRRAVVLIAHHTDTPDTIPCTQLMQFYIRRGSTCLDCIVTMRSSDAVWGLPYDMIQFGMVTHAMASCLGYMPGTVTVNMGNAHIYEDHKGGNTWHEEIFSMPVLTTWDEYRAWAIHLIGAGHGQLALQKIFNMRKEIV